MSPNEILCGRLPPFCNFHLQFSQSHGGDQIIPFSGALEAQLFDMPPDEQEAYCKEVGGGGGRLLPHLCFSFS